jgi:hypothetical protein
VTEPIVTWNLFLTTFLVPLCVAMLYGAIKRQFLLRDKKDEEISKLLEKRELEKEFHIRERWDQFTATQCSIKAKLDAMSKDLNNKVDWQFCHEKESDISRQIERIEDRIR